MRIRLTWGEELRWDRALGATDGGKFNLANGVLFRARNGVDAKGAQVVGSFGRDSSLPPRLGVGFCSKDSAMDGASFEARVPVLGIFLFCVMVLDIEI